MKPDPEALPAQADEEEGLVVLIADDNPDHRFLTRRAIATLAPRLGVKVLTATDGEDALDRVLGRGAHAREPRPHLLLLDIKMPRKDGFEVLQAIRAHPTRGRLPVVVFTSSENRGDVERARRLGADDYVTKPIDAQAFAGSVRAIVWAWAAEARQRGRATA